MAEKKNIKEKAKQKIYLRDGNIKIFIRRLKKK